MGQGSPTAAESEKKAGNSVILLQFVGLALDGGCTVTRVLNRVSRERE
jgi:hypothetical protein